MRSKKRKRERFLQQGTRAQRFFKELVDELDLMMTFGYRPAKVMQYGMQGVRWMRAAKERKWQREAMRRLIAQKLIEVTKKGEQYRVALTQHGVEQVFRTQIQEAELLPDSMTCFVIFDIPESQREIRQILRRFLIEVGFAPLQKSVWICRFDIVAPLTKLLVHRGEGKWIRVFIAEEK